MPKTAKKSAPKAKKRAKTAPKKKASNVISFTELYELKKKRDAEAAQKNQQQGWKDGTTGQTHWEESQEQPQANSRAGRTNGMGSRHH